LGFMQPFGVRDQERTLVMIDGGHFFSCHQSLGFTVDWAKMVTHLRESTRLTALVYYALVPADPTVKHAARPAIDWLAYNGGRIHTKSMSEFNDGTGRMRVRGTLIPEMSVDMVLAAPNIDHLILFAGDGEFSYPVEKVQERCRVTMVSTIESEEIRANTDLRRLVDNFVDVKDLRGLISKGASFRREDSETGATSGPGTLRLR